MTDDILDILVAHGVPGAVIVQVAKLIADAKITEQLRDSARERMRRVRERSRKHPNTPEQKSTNIEERKIEKEGSKVVRASRAKPKIPLPENWHPELAGDTEFQKFCDHARQNDRRCVDWEAALRNWNRNAPKFNGGQNGHGRRHGSVLDAFDRLGERLKAAGATDDYIPGSSGPRPLELDTQVRPTNLKLVSKG